jgi:hypothetical protein
MTTDFSKIIRGNLRCILNFKTISNENLNFAESFGNFLPNFFTIKWEMKSAEWCFGEIEEITMKKQIVKSVLIEYDQTLSGFIELLEAARRTAARSVNALMTATYWEIGRRIVEIEQQGQERADYGDDLIKRLGKDLTLRFGRGFGWRNLFQMRSFY